MKNAINKPVKEKFFVFFIKFLFDSSKKIMYT